MLLPLALALLLSACADPVERQIARLVEGGDRAEEAKMELNLAKREAVAPLVAAFADRSYPTQARVDLADAIYRLYMREADQRLLAALRAGLDDPEAAVRNTVVRALGDLGQQDLVDPLLTLLDKERDTQVQLQLLTALAQINGANVRRGGMDASEVRPERMSPEQRQRLQAALVALRAGGASGTLALEVREWLEILVEHKTAEAAELALKADLHGAEALYLKALDLVPDSKNANQRLGYFYYDNGQRAKGLDLLDRIGLVARPARLEGRPAIDGRLDDEVWSGVRPLTEFYQCIWKRSAYPIEGRAEVYLGYRDTSIFIAVRGYEPRTDNLTAAATQRDDGGLYRDDCVEIFINPDRQSPNTYYHILANSLGTLSDKHRIPGQGWDRAWNPPFAVATRLEQDAWILEAEFPVSAFGLSGLVSGDTWSFNIARTRIANASEYGQWSPTYGFAHRPDHFGLLVFD